MWNTTSAISTRRPACRSTAQDILTNANYALAVRDGFASFFFHPFWLEPEVGTPGFADFQTIITGITALGFTWADASVVQ